MGVGRFTIYCETGKVSGKKQLEAQYTISPNATGSIQGVANIDTPLSMERPQGCKGYGVGVEISSCGKHRWGRTDTHFACVLHRKVRIDSNNGGINQV